MNSRDDHDLPLAQPLTPREEEILILISEGMTNRQIAEELTIALSTVKWYARQIYNKLGVDNRAAAATRAQRLGLLPAEEREGEVRHNLPAAAMPFVGRERELDDLAELIADPQVRIITITGPGGIGKTRLALETAGREAQPPTRFSDGVFFVSLAPLESAAEIVATLAAALDFHFQDSGNETEQLLNYLRNKQMLLVMDNLEHILDGRALLAEVNERAAEITLMVTSRERLQLRGEQLFPLQGLEMAQTGDFVAEAPAAQLFLNIAKRTLPDFQLLEGDAEHLLHICRLVEGMPLGLELAASWVGLLPLSEIAAEIEQSLDLLTTEHHDVPQRHRSMQAALDVSWGRLTSEQQLAFRQLAVFRGGFTRTGAVGIAGATLPLLVTLVNKSWLSYDRQKDRYHIHELLRQYGAAKLNADPAHEQDVRERHGIYFCGYLQEREADWFGPRQKEAAAEVGAEIDNIQRAWRWAANQGNGVLLAQGLNSLCRFHLWEGQMTNGQNACLLAEAGLSRALAKQKDDGQRLALWSQVLAWESDFVREVTQKVALLSQSQQHLDRAAQTGRDTRVEQAFIFLEKSYATEYTDFDEAIDFASQGLALFRELGDRWGEAEALQVMGGCYDSRGEFELANDLLHSSLEIRRQLDDTIGIAETMVYLGFAATQLGHFEEAETFLRQSLHLYQQLNHQPGELFALCVLSNTLSWAGKFYTAREAATRALRMDQDIGQYPNPWRLNRLTRANIHLGHYTEARATGAEALEVSRQRNLSGEIGLALMYLGNTTFVEGDFAEAKRCLLESAAVLAETNVVLQAQPQAILSYMLRAQGDGQVAQDYLVNALRSGIEYRSISPVMYCLPAAALLAADDGNRERAIEIYGLAQRFGHIRNSRWFENVACRELDGVRASLPEDVATAAEARGREMDVWETAESLLRELDSS